MRRSRVLGLFVVALAAGCADATDLSKGGPDGSRAAADAAPASDLGPDDAGPVVRDGGAPADARADVGPASDGAPAFDARPASDARPAPDAAPPLDVGPTSDARPASDGPIVSVDAAPATDMGAIGDAGADGEVDAVPPDRVEYGPWGPWTPCAGGERRRERACLDETGSAVDCARCGGACTETEACERPDCAELGINVVNCDPGPPGDQAACDRVLVARRDRCEENGCRWEGADRCAVGGSVSSAVCFGGTGLCLDPDDPPPERFEYGPWGDWGDCEAGRRRRERPCLDGAGQPVDCARCGGACVEVEDCATCAELGGNVVNCNPAPPGDQAACDDVLVTLRARCLQNGCVWDGAERCAVGGSVSSAVCFGGAGVCLDPDAPLPERYEYEPWSAWGPCMDGERRRTRSCLDGAGQAVDCARCGGDCVEVEACAPDCARFGLNVLNCQPRAPGDEAACNEALGSARSRCLANGCRWDGPLRCVVGGSPSNGNCYGGLGRCLAP